MRKKRFKELPICSFDCMEKAKYDAPTQNGSWAFMCPEHMQQHGQMNCATELIEGIADHVPGPAVTAICDIEKSTIHGDLILLCPHCDQERRLELDAEGDFNCEGCGRALTVPIIL